MYLGMKSYSRLLLETRLCYFFIIIIVSRSSARIQSSHTVLVMPERISHLPPFSKNTERRDF